MKYELKDDEKDVITNSYLMSLAVFVTTMPIPVINLVANLYFYFSHRKSTYAVRWHALNSLFTQIPLFFINSFTWYVVWQIVWGEIKISNWIIAYLSIAVMLNIMEIISSIICCLKIQRDKEIEIPFISPLTHITTKKKEWDRWTESWKDVDHIFVELAEKAKTQIAKHAMICTAVIAVLFFSIAGINIVGREEIPNYSLENLFEEIVYDTSVKPHLITNKEKSEPLKKMVNYIVEKNGMDSINVYLVESKAVNAFAYAGRNLAVYTSLINECDNENELLAVLGHEIGHIEKRHVVRSIKTNIGLSIVFSALLGDFSSIATDITTNHKSRDFENEADALSVEYLYNADIDPSGFATFMKKMLTNTFLDKIDFFSDHPATQDRVDRSEAKVKSLPEKKYTTVLTKEEWENFKNLIKKKENNVNNDEKDSESEVVAVEIDNETEEISEQN